MLLTPIMVEVLIPEEGFICHLAYSYLFWDWRNIGWAENSILIANTAANEFVLYFYIYLSTSILLITIVFFQDRYFEVS